MCRAQAVTQLLAAVLLVVAGQQQPLANGGEHWASTLETLSAAGGRVVPLAAITPVPGGLSNTNHRVDTAGGASYIMRVPGDLALPRAHNYTRVHLVNRSLEARCAMAAFRAGVAPELVEYQPVTGVMLTRWLPGRVLTDTTLRAHLPLVARTLRTFHDTVDLRLGSAGADTGAWFSALDRAENYLALAGELGVAVPPAVAALPQGIAGTPQAGPLLLAAREAAAQLRVLAASEGRRPVALHCDLIPANFILEDDTGASGDADLAHRLWIFYFEFCHFGTARVRIRTCPAW